MSTNDGGPAFPVAADVNPDGRSAGMTLRDYFAAKAMNALVNWNDSDDAVSQADIARAAYAIANAMIAARVATS
jgi:hypothetical protein